MRREFAFDHIQRARIGDAMHFHAYALAESTGQWHLRLADRASTDGIGIARCLGLQASAKVELAEILALIDARLPMSVPITLAATATPPHIGT